jgi:hypothetical protein
MKTLIQCSKTSTTLKGFVSSILRGKVIKMFMRLYQGSNGIINCRYMDRRSEIRYKPYNLLPALLFISS